jgi:hypothetical protein
MAYWFVDGGEISDQVPTPEDETGAYAEEVSMLQ